MQDMQAQMEKLLVAAEDCAARTERCAFQVLAVFPGAEHTMSRLDRRIGNR